jgi:hypothetical protein
LYFELNKNKKNMKAITYAAYGKLQKAFTFERKELGEKEVK